VIFASGLKYVGLGTTALGWTLCVVLLAGGGYWLARARPWQNGQLLASTADGRPPGAVPGAPGERAAPGGRPANGHRAAEPAWPRTGEPGAGNDSAPNG
jgi:hypothetical protein